MRANANTQKVNIICGVLNAKNKQNKNKQEKHTFSSSPGTQALQIICATSVYWTQNP